MSARRYISAGGDVGLDATDGAPFATSVNPRGDDIIYVRVS
jgi:hypothetical protein